MANAIHRIGSFLPLIVATSITAQNAQKPTETTGHFGLTAGMMSINLGETSAYQHKTHPDDYFLSGSPGSTSIQTARGFKLGLEGSVRHGIIEPYLGGALVFFGHQEDNHQNDNDPRSASNAAFVYTKIKPVGLHANAGLRLHPLSTSDEKGGPYLFGEINVTHIGFEHGWDRWGSQQQASKTTANPVMVGGGIGWKFASGFALEAGYEKSLDQKTSMMNGCIKYFF